MSQYIVTQSLIFSYLRVYEKENERKIKTYRVPGKVVNGFNSSSNLTARLEGDLTTVSSLRRHKEERLVEGGGEGEGNDSKCSSDKPVDCDSSTIILTPQVKVEAFSSRNQFDRASQLRRSRKKSRRKSDVQGNASLSASRDESVLNSEEMFSTSRAEYSSNYGNLI